MKLRTKKQARKTRRFAVPSALAAASAIGSTASGKLLTPREKATAARVLSGDAKPDIDSMDRPLMRDAVIEALGALGIDKVYIGHKIKSGLEATETRFFAEKGIVTDEREVIAWGPRKSYLDTLLQIMGIASKGGDGQSPAGAVDAVYKSHLGEETETVAVRSPRDGMIKRRMQAQKPTNRRGL